MRPLKFGVTVHDPARAMPGFTLFSPTGGRESLLIGMEGEIKHQWRLPGLLGGYGQLMPNGNLLVTTVSDEGPKGLAAKAGRILELDWDGEIVWEYTDHNQHHDFNRAANGNTVYLAWEFIPTDEAHFVPGGMPDSEHADGGVYVDVLREVNPAGEMVWEWRLAEHFPFDRYPLRSTSTRREFAHANACFIRPDGNVMMSWRELDLIAVIDRQSSKFLWEMQDRSWGGQHDPHLLDNGNITLFANGSEQPSPEHSRILELDPNSREIVWEYKGSPPVTFFSPRVSGAQRQPNGNTLICEGSHGRLFEVTMAGDIVWEYISPFYNPFRDGVLATQIFRARRYTPDSPEIGGRIKLAS